MSKIFELLEILSKTNYLSGNESTYKNQSIPEPFFALGASLDCYGNLIVEKKSPDKNAKTILIEAHLDTIGLCVKDILPGGFLAVSASGGFDPNILPGTEFKIYSKSTVKGIATSVAPHLQKSKDGNQKLDLNEIYLDCGFSSDEEAKAHIEIGAPIEFSAPCQKLCDHCISAPSLDNKAAVAALILAIEKVQSPHNLIFLFSVGEETTSRGVKQIDLRVKPDVAFVVDAGFAYTKGLNPDQCIIMQKGPSISIADTLSRSVAQWVITTAKKNDFPLQIVVEPGGTGTSGTALQLRYGGIPCGLISIPLKYMHTPSEVVCETDVESTSDLLCLLLQEKELVFGEVNLVG